MIQPPPPPRDPLGLWLKYFMFLSLVNSLTYASMSKISFGFSENEYKKNLSQWSVSHIFMQCFPFSVVFVRSHLLNQINISTSFYDTISVNAEICPLRSELVFFPSDWFKCHLADLFIVLIKSFIVDKFQMKKSLFFND